LKGNAYINPILYNAQQFLQQLSQFEFVQNAYGTNIPENHKQAILQHYGFPTELLDCTYSYDVALFFAEGAKDSAPVAEESSECGSIYAFPSHIIPKNAVILSLPPAIMRASLQRGVFISNLDSNDIELLEQHKFTFKHKKMPVWNGLSDIQFGSPIGLSHYLFPTADPIEMMAEPLRHNKSIDKAFLEENNKKSPKLGETPEGIWIAEVLQNCVIEKQEGYQSIDLNLLIQMCKNEPKSALVALQIFSDNMMKLLNGKSVEEADGFAINLRLLIGSIAMGYMISQDRSDGTAPEELALVATRYPIIKDCLSYVLSFNKDIYKD
jgi:hypothetical protein